MVGSAPGQDIREVLECCVTAQLSTAKIASGKLKQRLLPLLAPHKAELSLCTPERLRGSQ
jgi:hypothetical protein